MPDNDVPAAVRQQCYCCAAYGLYRLAVRGGLCVMCVVLPHLCETGHRMAAKHAADGSAS